MQDGGFKLAGQMTTLDVVWRHNQQNGIMWSLYGIIHIWTAVVDESKKWSSQIIFQFKHLERGSLKKSGLQRKSNQWPLRYRSDALPTELITQLVEHWEIYCDDHSSILLKWYHLVEQAQGYVIN